MVHRLMVPLAVRALVLSIVTAGIVSVLVAAVRFLHDEQTMSATLREISAGVSWTGNAVASGTSFDSATCQDFRTCEVFTLKIDISEMYRKNHPDFAVAVRLGWEDSQSDFDLYVGRNDEVIEGSSQGQTNSEEVYLDQPVNGPYRVFTHTVSAAPASAYIARVRVLPSSPAPSHRTARYQQDTDGIDGPAVFEFMEEPLLEYSTADEGLQSGIGFDPFGKVRVAAEAGAGDSVTDRSGTHFKVFTGASRGEIYLSRCAQPCTQSVTRRIFSGASGSTLDHPCPVIAADLAGGLHVAFSDGHQVFLISSADHGISWKDPVPVSNSEDPHTAPASSPSIFAGDSGRVGLLWVNRAGELFYGVTLDAFDPSPSIDYVRLTGAQDPSKLPVGTVDPFGNAAIVYSGTTILRQTAGRRLLFTSYMTVAGTLETETGTKKVGFTVRQDFGGYLTFVDEVRKLSMKSARFTSSKHVDGKIALSGRGDLDDGTTVTFTMLTNVPDNPERDFSISMSNGYFAAGVVQNTPLLAAKMLNDNRRTE